MTEEKKKIIFTVLAREKEDFKIQLQYDGMTQAHFFRAIMQGYLVKDPIFLQYLSAYKQREGIQNHAQRRKILSSASKALVTKKLFSLDDDEVDNIFDILESENPDL
tara:strand:+ start:2892 stop:3212 length:321 start_codon:yes stop_codon:yes gene_type:complete